MSEQLKPSEVLERAAALIEPEGAWTQRAFAKDCNGQIVSKDDPAAACFCAAGATWRTIGNADGLYTPVHRYFLEASGWTFFAFNDAEGRTQAEVVSALRKAAELARSEGH